MADWTDPRYAALVAEFARRADGADRVVCAGCAGRGQVRGGVVCRACGGRGSGLAAVRGFRVPR
jgi:RecJ-like exonuclease